MEILISNTIYSYICKDMDYYFAEDIKIGNWEIHRTVKNRYKVKSNYKWEADSNLVFSITDKNGITKNKVWFYFRNDYGLPAVKNDEDNINRIKRFIENSILFKCETWDDYESTAFVLGVKNIIDEVGDNLSKRNRIEYFVKHPIY